MSRFLYKVLTPEMARKNRPMLDILACGPLVSIVTYKKYVMVSRYGVNRKKMIEKLKNRVGE